MIIKGLFQTVLFLEYQGVQSPGRYSDSYSVAEDVIAEKVSLEVIFKDGCVCVWLIGWG